MSATARLEVRLDPEAKTRIAFAAELDQRPVSDFVRSAIEARVDQVIRQHEARTNVPADFFDDLLAALDEPDQPNEALRRAARRHRASSAER
jgi:uncharacterized protein (DUF1778 family)